MASMESAKRLNLSSMMGEPAQDGIDVGGLPPPWFLLDDGDKDAEADDRIRLSGLGDLGGVLAVGVDGLRGACVTGEAKPEWPWLCRGGLARATLRSEMATKRARR